VYASDTAAATDTSLADLLDVGSLRVFRVGPVNECGDIPGVADRSASTHKGVDQTVGA
jgi:hypothetical protein